ncbi:MAG TPA: DUF3455 domain-containing protein [Candidatus Saccharimonadales bacterium]|nr:DUF3455 domain-containing protein [Candidatus Saccharimonadales bacterium]
MNAFYALVFLALFVGGAIAQGRPAVPDSINPPESQQLVLRGHASGDQVYTCQAAAGGDSQLAWVLSGPEAKLTDDAGKAIATHFAGPTWQSTDGSQVKGKMVSQSIPDPSSIPWLLLAAVDHSGTGIMSNVSSIQRLNTKGGKAPAAGCDAQHQGEKTRVSYTADYYFYSAAK